ncbi:MAG TPA: nucleotidyltransferase family protein [Gemmatimonadaceae bacterium]|jgi:hypothetical protein|nr:nucleotidyltransferase family protein [Gemmatimonadaceae bacterium]
MTSSAAAVYDIVSAAVRGRSVSDIGPSSLATWERVLCIEACGPWLEWACRRDPGLARAMEPARHIVRAQSEAAVAHALAIGSQLAEIASLAPRYGRVLVLKGAARLLSGEPAGRRTMADIDLLVERPTAWHQALQRELGYRPDDTGTPSRHLPALIRAESLAVEIHTQLADRGSGLDTIIWQDTRTPVPGLEIPSAVALARHTLEHATVVHRTLRYRLRDVLDVSAVCTDAPTDFPIERAAETLVAAAGFRGEREADRAWRTVRRVALARLAVPATPRVAGDLDPLVYVASQLAEGSPAVLAGLAWRAVCAPLRTVATVRGALARGR